MARSRTTSTPPAALWWAARTAIADSPAGRSSSIPTAAGPVTAAGPSAARTPPRSTAARPTWPGTWPRISWPPDWPIAARCNWPTRSASPIRLACWSIPKEPASRRRAALRTGPRDVPAHAGRNHQVPRSPPADLSHDRRGRTFWPQRAGLHLGIDPPGRRVWPSRWVCRQPPVNRMQLQRGSVAEVPAPALAGPGRSIACRNGPPGAMRHGLVVGLGGDLRGLAASGRRTARSAGSAAVAGDRRCRRGPCGLVPLSFSPSSFILHPSSLVLSSYGRAATLAAALAFAATPLPARLSFWGLMILEEAWTLWPRG